MIQSPSSPLDGFPDHEILEGTPLFRCHRAGGLWWFATDARGRFNLTGRSGTCYFGLDRVTAVREVLRDDLDGNEVTVDQVAD